MLLLAYLVACACNDDTDGNTPVDVGTNDDDDKSPTAGSGESGTPTPSGFTGDTGTGAGSDPCEGALACWRFEGAGTEPNTVDDLSGNGNTLTLDGKAEVTGPAVVLPDVENLGHLFVDGEPDRAFLVVDDTNLAELTGGFTLEMLIAPYESTGFAADEQGDRIRYVAWLEDDLLSVRLQEDDVEVVDEKTKKKKTVTQRSLVARVNYSEDEKGVDEPGLCGVEASAVVSATRACVSVTYGNDELVLFVNGKEVASTKYPGGCETIGPAAEGARFQVGADESTSAVDDEKLPGDRTFRGDIDELILRAGPTAAGDLRCSQR